METSTKRTGFGTGNSAETNSTVVSALSFEVGPAYLDIWTACVWKMVPRAGEASRTSVHKTRCERSDGDRVEVQFFQRRTCSLSHVI